MGIPVLVKIVRIVNISVCLRDYANTFGASNNIGGSAAVGLLTTGFPFMKIEWSLQIFDDLYVFCSSFKSSGR